jgi:L-ascorbate metabolism protein UlaG (beta-lactamase superfamily)
MKIEYISHSALLIDTGDIKILTDPWIKNSAYCDQWHLFPRPINAEIENEADVILFSHGHEDHLHHESLISLDKNSICYFPYTWQKGIKEYFKELGFDPSKHLVTYAPAGKKKYMKPGRLFQ